MLDFSGSNVTGEKFVTGREAQKNYPATVPHISRIELVIKSKLSREILRSSDGSSKRIQLRVCCFEDQNSNLNSSDPDTALDSQGHS
jgi:hypothetical protein